MKKLTIFLASFLLCELGCANSKLDEIHYPVSDLNTEVNGNHAVVTWTTKQNVSAETFIDYAVYRFTLGTPEANWTLLAEHISDDSFVDIEWSTLPQGTYLYGVKAIYADGISVSQYSNMSYKGYTVVYTVDVFTNSDDNADGAVVTLTNQNGYPEYIYSHTLTTGSVTFPEVHKGRYDLSIKKDGFDPYTKTDIFIEGDGSQTAVLTEIAKTLTQMN